MTISNDVTEQFITLILLKQFIPANEHMLNDPPARLEYTKPELTSPCPCQNILLQAYGSLITIPPQHFHQSHSSLYSMLEKVPCMVLRFSKELHMMFTIDTPTGICHDGGHSIFCFCFSFAKTFACSTKCFSVRIRSTGSVSRMWNELYSRNCST